MKKILALSFVLTAVLIYSSCSKQKETTDQATAPAAKTDASETNAAAPPAPAACATKYLDLVIDPATGGSFLYRIVNSPSNAPVGVFNVNGSAGNNQIGSSLPATTVFKMTGLSYDPATGICYGVTGNGGSHPNSLIRFNVGDPNVVGIAPLISVGAGLLNLSDIERNPATGRYYAINRAVAGNNRLVIVDVTTGNVFPLPLATGLNLRGLAMDPGGKIYLMRMNGTSGDVFVADPGTGGIILGPCPYGVVIAPGVFGPNAEMGLHFDDVCTNLLITGNFNGTSFRLTDALPACFGGPIPPSIPVGIKPTVDFSRLN